MNEIQAAVNDYVAQGLSVIPVGPDKVPLRDETGKPLEWKPYQERRPTKEELREWFGGDDPPGVAVVCGPISGGLVAVDLDDLDIAQAVACDIELQSATTLAETPRGGCHVWLRETEAASRCCPLKDKDGKPIGDLKGAGGYVLAPPTPGYRFISQVGPLAVPEAYAWAAETLRGVGVDLAGRQNGDRPRLDVKAGLEGLRAPTEKEGGNRDVTFARVAGALHRHGTPPAEIVEVLAPWGERVGFTRRELETEVQRLCARYPSGEKGGTEVRLRRVRASDLVTGEPYTPEYLPLLGMDGFIVKGWSHILAAYPKTGKTELITDAVRTWLSQSECVLFFTEEPEEIWRLRLAQRTEGLDGLVLVPAMGAGTEAVLAEVERAEEGIVVIDTTRHVLGLQDEKDNSEVSRVLGPIIVACRERKQTPVLLHHHTKAGGAHGRAIAGGHAFLGIVDIALELERGNPAQPNQRVLTGYARVIQVPDVVYERNDAGLFVPLGVPQAVAFEALKEWACETLTEAWQPTKEVLGAMGDDKDRPKPSENALRKVLTSLVRDGRAERDPPLSEKGGSGSKYQWKVNAP